MILCLTEANMNLAPVKLGWKCCTKFSMCLHVYIKLLGKKIPIDPEKFSVDMPSKFGIWQKFWCNSNLTHYGIELTSIVGFQVMMSYIWVEIKSPNWDTVVGVSWVFTVWSALCLVISVWISKSFSHSLAA